MSGPYALCGENVLCEGRDELTRKQLDTAISRALRRKMRLAGFDADFRRTLDETGHATITWRYARHNADGSADWVTFEATRRQRENAYSVLCVGTQAAYAIERINKTFLELLPKRAKRRHQEAARRRTASRRQERKRRRFEERKAQMPASAHTSEKRVPAPAPIGKDKTRVTRQYQHTVVTWKEAVTAAVFVFDRHGDRKHSAAQLAARELFESFDASGHRFAQIKRDGFTLRFDRIRPVVDEDWIWGADQNLFFNTPPRSRQPVDLNLLWERFEDTLFSVWCTKDNRDWRYRRVHQHFRVFIGLSGGKLRQERRALLAATASALAA